MSQENDVRPGDVVVFNWDGRNDTGWCDHVGVVEWSTIGQNGAFGTIEGNTGWEAGGAVKRVTRTNWGSYFTAFFRPKYGSGSNSQSAKAKETGGVRYKAKRTTYIRPGRKKASGLVTKLPKGTTIYLKNVKKNKAGGYWGEVARGQYKGKFTCVKNRAGVVKWKRFKTVAAIAKEVIAGKWGDGDLRTQKLTKAGYDAAKVQAKVNELMS